MKFRFRVAHSILLAAVCAGGLQGCNPADASDQRMLVSITGVTLAPMQFVSGLSVETFNLDVLAICNVPPGWDMKASSPTAGPSVGVGGGASGGVASLEGASLKELQGLFLVKTLEYGDGPSDYKITGELAIEVRAEEPGWLDYPLTPTNIVVEPADRCPPPPRR